MPAKSKPAKENEPAFEEAMARLEEIVEKMENADLPLEEMIDRYEEGVRLVAVCSSKLDAAEKRIQIITKKASGEDSVEDFEAPATLEPKPESLDEVSLF